MTISSERSTTRSFVVSRRWDQLGGRLSAIVNAAALAEHLGLEARFVWPRGLDEVVNDPRALFTPEYLADCELEPAALEGLRVIPFRELSDDPSGDGVCVDVDLIFDALRLDDETMDVATDRFVRCWARIGWSDAVRELMRRCDDALAAFAGAGVHVRAGDIIDGGWRHVLGHEKYMPTPYIEHAVTTLGGGGRRVLVLSDNAPYLARLAESHPSVVTAAELIPGYAALPEIRRGLVDILALSHCGQIVGPPFSAAGSLRSPERCRSPRRRARQRGELP